MKFFKKIGQALGIIEENKTKEIEEERSEIKLTMAKNLKSIGFGKEEIDEVLNIITEAEAKIQEQKDKLIGTNINNPDVNNTMKPIFDEIKKIQLKMGDDIRLKISEIKQRKNL